MNHQAAIIRAASRRGKDPTELSKREYNALRIEVRTRAEVASDGFKMALGRVQETFKILRVSDAQKDGNLGTCRTNQCGSFAVLADGTEVCHRCNCGGRDLENKAASIYEHCPAEPPLWDNRTPKMPLTSGGIALA